MMRRPELVRDDAIFDTHSLSATRSDQRRYYTSEERMLLMSFVTL
jgi:hypothetical protein